VGGYLDHAPTHGGSVEVVSENIWGEEQRASGTSRAVRDCTCDQRNNSWRFALSLGTSANFSFQSVHDPQLVRLVALAEQYFHKDPNTYLIKLRKALRICLCDMGVRQDWRMSVTILDAFRDPPREICGTSDSRSWSLNAVAYSPGEYDKNIPYSEELECVGRAT
jgi:hypothetical protein